MGLENILEVAEDLGYSKEEVEQKFQEHYISFLRKGNPGAVENLANFTGIEPKYPEDEVKQVYLEKLDNWEIFKLGSIRKFTGVDFEFSKDLIQEKYDKMMDGRYLDHIRDLRKLTGVDPDLPTEPINEIYFDILRNGGSTDLTRPPEKNDYVWMGLNMVESSTGIKPPEISHDFAQELYNNYFERDELHNISGLNERYGFSPNFSNDFVQSKYEKYFEKRDFESFRRARDLTNIEPNLPKESVQKIFVDFVHGSDYGNAEWLLNLGMGYAFSEDFIRDFYLNGARSFAGNSDRDQIDFVRRKTGVPLSDDIIQKKYSDYINSAIESGMTNFTDVYRWREFSRVRPSEEIVMDTYRTLAENNDLQGVLGFKESSGHKVPDEIAQKCYEHLLEKYHPGGSDNEDFEFLRKEFGVAPSKEVYKTLIDKFEF